MDYTGKFCSSHFDQINLTDINLTDVTRVKTGVIYSPNYESESFNKASDFSACKINIATSKNELHDSLIVFRMV